MAIANISSNDGNVQGTANPTTGWSNQFSLAPFPPQFANILSSGFSGPITVTLTATNPIFGNIVVVGQTQSSGSIQVFDANGNLLSNYDLSDSADELNPGQPFRFDGTQASAWSVSSNQTNITIQLIPPPNSVVGYSIGPLTTFTPQVPAPPITTPSAPIPPPQAPAPTTTVTPAPVVDISSFVSFSKLQTQRSYTKTTLAPIPPDSFTITNSSDTFSVSVGFSSIAGVSFTPATTSIQPGQTQTITIQFDSAQIDSFPEGLTDITAIVNLSATSS